MNKCKNIEVTSGRMSCSCHIIKESYDPTEKEKHLCNKSEDELYLDNLCFDLSNEETLEELFKYNDPTEKENEKCCLASEWVIERTFNAIKELECISYLENNSFSGFNYFKDNKYSLSERKQELYNEIKNMTNEIKDRI